MYTANYGMTYRVSLTYTYRNIATLPQTAQTPPGSGTFDRTDKESEAETRVFFFMTGYSGLSAAAERIITT